MIQLAILVVLGMELAWGGAPLTPEVQVLSEESTTIYQPVEVMALGTFKHQNSTYKITIWKVLNI